MKSTVSYFSPERRPRREFLQGSLAASAALLVGRNALGLNLTSKPPKICAFIKYLQAYSFDELAERIAELGFDGIEATIRHKGYIEPEHAPDELPRLVETLKKHGLEITVMTTDVLRVDQPYAEDLLSTAADLGIRQYRMGYYFYDLKQPVAGQLEELRPAINDIVALNRQLGIQGLYQNHSGATFVGAPLWDMYSLVKDHPVKYLAVAFDICHATIEGGLAWPLHYNLLQPHIGVVFVKDFHWAGRKLEIVPFGTGNVDYQFFELLLRDHFSGPYSLQVEYLNEASPTEYLSAFKADLNRLRKLL